MEVATVFDVAEYILKKTGPITAMKLEKLVYYCQAWSLVWDERPLFSNRIEAWANGPVAPDLYNWHRGLFEVESCSKGDPTKIDLEGVETIEAVLSHYCQFSGKQLSDLSHSENPWIEAREGLQDGERGDRVISLASMAEYYTSL